MTTLTQYCQQQAIDCIWAMNELQDQGLVSDCCVTTEDVAEADCAAAIRYLAAVLAC